MISARTGYWTFELGEAYGVAGDFPNLFGGKVVPVDDARKVLLSKIEHASDAAKVGYEPKLQDVIDPAKVRFWILRYLLAAEQGGTTQERQKSGREPTEI